MWPARAKKSKSSARLGESQQTESLPGYIEEAVCKDEAKPDKDLASSIHGILPATGMPRPAGFLEPERSPSLTERLKSIAWRKSVCGAEELPQSEEPRTKRSFLLPGLTGGRGTSSAEAPPQAQDPRRQPARLWSVLRGMSNTLESPKPDDRSGSLLPVLRGKPNESLQLPVLPDQPSTMRANVWNVLRAFSPAAELPQSDAPRAKPASLLPVLTRARGMPNAAESPQPGTPKTMRAGLWSGLTTGRGVSSAEESPQTDEPKPRRAILFSGLTGPKTQKESPQVEAPTTKYASLWSVLRGMSNTEEPAQPNQPRNRRASLLAGLVRRMSDSNLEELRQSEAGDYFKKLLVPRGDSLDYNNNDNNKDNNDNNDNPLLGEVVEATWEPQGVSSMPSCAFSQHVALRSQGSMNSMPSTAFGQKAELRSQGSMGSVASPAFVQKAELRSQESMGSVGSPAFSQHLGLRSQGSMGSIGSLASSQHLGLRSQGSSEQLGMTSIENSAFSQYVELRSQGISLGTKRNGHRAAIRVDQTDLRVEKKSQKLALKYKLEPKDVKRILMSLDVVTAIGIDFPSFSEKFLEALERWYLPQQRLALAYKASQAELGGPVNLDMLLAWCKQTCESDLAVAKQAAAFGLDDLEIQKMRTLFAEVDTDDSGTVEYSEFEAMMMRLMGISDVADLPRSRVDRFWKEADKDGSGWIDQAEFMKLYVKYFSDDCSERDAFSS